VNSPAVGDGDGVSHPGVSLSKAPSQPSGTHFEAPAPVDSDEPIWAMGTNGQSMSSADTPPFPLWPVPTTPPRRRMSRRDVIVEVVWALAIAVVIAALGLPLGWLWATISPHVTLEMTASGPSYVMPNPEGYAGGESVYVLLCIATGLATSVTVWLLGRRRRGPILLVGFAAGSIAGSLLMAWIGHRIGLADYHRLVSSAPLGTRFEIPVEVRSTQVYRPRIAGLSAGVPLVRGAALVQAMIGVALYTVMAGFYPTGTLAPAPRQVPDPFSSDFPEPQDHPMVPAPPAAG
jgi:hypothetical protein